MLPIFNEAPAAEVFDLHTPGIWLLKPLSMGVVKIVIFEHLIL